jgi:uncharacterized cofD-like protein
MSRSQIVTIGGGTGAPVIIRSLLQAGFSNIKAVSASMDSGGKTGTIRSDERDRVIAISDTLRSLIALLPPNKDSQANIQAFIDLISFTDGRNRNLGYTLYYSLLEKYKNNFLKVQDHLEKLLEIKFQGQAIPVTTDSTNIIFQTQSGIVFSGEHEFDRQTMSSDQVRKIWLKPQVKATPQAIQAIKKADYLIFCPGSLYGSIIVNLLPTGIKLAFKQTKAQKILLTNLVSSRNQTHKFTPLDYLRLFVKYTNLQKPFDLVIAPHLSARQFNRLYPKISHNYELQYSHFMGWPDSQFRALKAKKIQVIRADIFSFTSQLNRVRHDPAKLALLFRKKLR